MSLKRTIKKLVNDTLLSGLNLRIYSTQAFGRDLINDLKNLLGEPKIMFDVGANVGQTVDNWSNVFNAPKIYSFEPVRRLFETLHADYGDLASCHHLGVGDENKEITINYGKHDVSHSFIKSDEGRGGEQVNVVTLDDFCREHSVDHIDVLKIDVEGFEFNVIDGARGLLSQQKVDVLIVELGVDPNGYYVFYPDFAAKMAEFGYATLGFYDQTYQWDGSAELLFCNVLFARKGLKFAV